MRCILCYRKPPKTKDNCGPKRYCSGPLKRPAVSPRLVGRVVRLRCEHLENPLAVNTLAVRLTWEYSDQRPGAGARAYQIQAASSEERLLAAPDLWDSGKCRGDVGPVVYVGRSLPRGGT